MTIADNAAFNKFHPVLTAWFRDKFGQAIELQLRAWEQIADGSHTLIVSPTGSGKTLASLLPGLDRIVKSKASGIQYAPGVRVLYVTPLKALNNDIYDHLLHFHEELEQTAERLGSAWPGLSVAVRTGDTATSTRASMLKNPPDVLITTPESLFLLLTSRKGRDMLNRTEQVIVDEIHDLAADKRGVHLSLSLERLEEWVGRHAAQGGGSVAGDGGYAAADGLLQRIGVSATQKPLERVARFLGGWEWDRAASQEERNGFGEAEPMSPRTVRIVESTSEKRYELTVTMPEEARFSSSNRDETWERLVDKLFELMEGSSSTLVFVSSRRLCERLTLRLNERAGGEWARPHHGSVSREKRLEVESMMKAGTLKCIVATSSLELGIDVGHVELVVQVDSPKGAAAGIQRIGRAGHNVGGISRGRIVVRSRGGIGEAAVVARLIAAREIEEIVIPRHSLDVLSQQLVAMVAVDDWDPGQLYELIARSDCYRAFPRERLAALLDVLAGLYPFARPLLDWRRISGADVLSGVLSSRGNTAMSAYMGAGAIPSSAAYPVHHLESRVHLGELDETYVFESRVGDSFQLGSSTWTIRSIQSDRVYVTEQTGGHGGEIPFWNAETAGRSYELGSQLGGLYRDIAERLGDYSVAAVKSAARMQTQEWLMEVCMLDARTADHLIDYIQQQKVGGALPTDRVIATERFKDEAGYTHLVIHSLFGKKVNRTWQLLMELTMRERGIAAPRISTVKDDGIEFVFSEWEDETLSAIRSVDANMADRELYGVVLDSPMFAAQFRHLAETSLLLTRGFQRTATWVKRQRSEQLLKSSLPFAERFPLIREAAEQAISELLDAEKLIELLRGIESGAIRFIHRESFAPSSFAIQFTFQSVVQHMYESDALPGDIRLQLLSFNKELAQSVFGAEALKRDIPPEAIAAERERLEQVAGGFGETDSMYRLLKERGDHSAEQLLRLYGSNADDKLRELSQSGRITAVTIGGETRFICADELQLYTDFPDMRFALFFVLNRYASHSLTLTHEDLCSRFGLAEQQAAQWLEESVRSAAIVPAPFAADGGEGLYCSKEVAERLIRYSIRHYRSRTEAIDPVRYCLKLMEQQHLLPHNRLQGQEGLRTVIAQLQGQFLPITLWETTIFPARIADYRQDDLDLLCASGEVIWVGRKKDGEKEGRIALFLAESKELYAPFARNAGINESGAITSGQPELLALLRRRGATFLSVLSRETGLVPSELQNKLFDLVWEGYVSNDQFSPLRMKQTAPARGRAKPRTGGGSGFGRWYVLDTLFDNPVENERSALQWMRHLLDMNGIVTKETVEEQSPYSWTTMSGMLRKLEEWGAAARGLHVRDVARLQYASTQFLSAVSGMENLISADVPVRAAANRETDARSAAGQIVALASVDPANPFGIAADWPTVRKANATAAGFASVAQFARKPGNYLIFRDGEWIMWLEHYGKRIFTMDGSLEMGLEHIPDLEIIRTLKNLFKTFLRQNGLRKIVIEAWNGRRVDERSASRYLTELGAEKAETSYVIWPSSL